MKILFIATGFLPYLFSENLCNAKLVYALQKAGWDIDVISKPHELPSYGKGWSEPWLNLEPHTYEVSYKKGTTMVRFTDVIYSSFYMGVNYPIEGIRWARRAYKEALKKLKQNHYDAVMTRSPSDIAHIVGFKLKIKTGCKWIANWNDPSSTIWPEPYTYHFPKRKEAILHKLTAKWLQVADINTFPGKPLYEHFCKHFPFLKEKHCEIIPHIALPKSLVPIIEARKGDAMTICHSGNLSKERNPELTFQALRQLIDDEENVKIRLEIMGHVNDYTLGLITKYNLENNVNFTGSFPYMESVKQLQKYDVLLLLEAILDRGIFFASKTTDYALTGLPILAISPPIGFAHDLIEEYGGGIAVNNTDVGSIKAGLLQLYRSWQNGTLEKQYNSDRIYALCSPKVVAEKYDELLK